MRKLILFVLFLSSCDSGTIEKHRVQQCQDAGGTPNVRESFKCEMPGNIDK